MCGLAGVARRVLGGVKHASADRRRQLRFADGTHVRQAAGRSGRELRERSLERAVPLGE